MPFPAIRRCVHGARIPIADLARIVIDRATSRRREPTKLILGRSPAHCPVTDARLSLLIYIYKRGGSRRDILECPRFLTCPRRQRAHTRQHLLAISSFEGRPSSCSSSLPVLPSFPASEQLYTGPERCGDVERKSHGADGENERFVCHGP